VSAFGQGHAISAAFSLDLRAQIRLERKLRPGSHQGGRIIASAGAD
jgi:hypothetical protein